MRLILDMPPMSFNGFPHQGVPRISPSAAAASKPTPGPRAVTWLKRQKFGRKGINCGFLPWVNWQSSAFGHSRVPNLSVSPFLLCLHVGSTSANGKIAGRTGSCGTHLKQKISVSVDHWMLSCKREAYP